MPTQSDTGNWEGERCTSCRAVGLTVYEKNSNWVINKYVIELMLSQLCNSLRHICMTFHVLRLADSRPTNDCAYATVLRLSSVCHWRIYRRRPTRPLTTRAPLSKAHAPQCPPKKTFASLEAILLRIKQRSTAETLRSNVRTLLNDQSLGVRGSARASIMQSALCYR